MSYSKKRGSRSGNNSCKEKSAGQNERAGLAERLSRALDLQPDIFSGAGLIEIRGRGAVTVNGGGHILDYTDTLVRIEFKRGAAAIRGRRLVCASFCIGRVRIEGYIEGVEFENSSF